LPTQKNIISKYKKEASRTHFVPHCVLGLKPSGLITGDKEEIPRLGISPNFTPALKKFSALFHEENFFEGSKLSLSPMLVSIFENAYK
jgi:hypothetical protein